MKKILLAIIILFLINQKSESQITLTFQPDGLTGKDAILRSLSPTTNYGWHPDNTAEATTNGGNFVAIRSLIDFNLSQIPSNALIVEAKLYLYTYNSPNTGQHMGSNECYIQRVTSSWDENTVTWNSSPNTTVQNQVSLPAFTNIDQNYIVDVKNLVQDYVNNASSSFGFMLRLQNETVYRKMIFASSDNSNPALRPKLVINYIIPIEKGSKIKVDTNGHISYLNDINMWIPVNPGLPGQTLLFNAGIPSWVNNTNGITTIAITNITTSSASSGGNVISDGGAKITARGVCWSTTPNPTIADSKTIDGSGIGNFTSNLSGLTPGTTYYIRVYATSSAGTVYGNELSFTTN